MNDGNTAWTNIGTPENVTKFWENVFRYDIGLFAIVTSLVSWILILVWLETSQLGGLGLRNSSTVTREYFKFSIIIWIIVNFNYL